MCGIHIERSKSSSLCWHLFSKKSHFVTSFLLITYIATGGFLAVMKYSRVSRPAPVGSSSNPHPSRQTTRTSRDALKTPKESTTKPSSLVYKKNWATLYSLRADISHVYLLMCLFIFWCVFSWKRSFVLYDENVPYPPWGWSLFVGINSHRAGSGMRWVRLRKCDQSIMLSIFKSCGFRSSFSLYVIFATEVSWNFAQNFVFMFAASRWTRCSFFPLSEMRNGARRGCYRGVGINLKKVPWDFFFFRRESSGEGIIGNDGEWVLAVRHLPFHLSRRNERQFSWTLMAPFLKHVFSVYARNLWLRQFCSRNALLNSQRYSEDNRNTWRKSNNWKQNSDFHPQMSFN